MKKDRLSPIRMHGAPKTALRAQFAALCWTIRQDRLRVLLVTTRGSGTWIIPKGWPVDGLAPGEVAAREAWEEAGVRGQAAEHCLGVWSYAKADGADGILPCLAMVYPVEVRSLAKDWPEKGQRRRKWFSRKKAAERVGAPDLAAILRSFDPARLS